MANLASFARPYALAAFEVAHEHDSLPQWKIFLDAAAKIADDKQLAQLIRNPEIQPNKFEELFAGILQAYCDEHRRNFLRLLAHNRRLYLLPDIATLYAAYLAELERMSNIRVITATAVDDAYKQTLSKALGNRMKQNVTLHCEIDPSIIGGAIIHIGDRVIDGSVRGKLTRLLEFSLR